MIGPLCIALAWLVLVTHGIEQEQRFVVVRNISVDDANGTKFLVHNMTSGNESSLIAPVLASLLYQPSMLSVGWDRVVVRLSSTEVQYSTPQNVSDLYEAAGYLEAYVTQSSIFNLWRNTNGGYSAQLNAEVRAWIAEHRRFMMSWAESEYKTNDTARMLRKLLRQVKGLHLGYNARCDELGLSDQHLTEDQVFYHNFQNEIGDIATAYQKEKEIPSESNSDRMPPHPLHCSALIKVLPDDLYFSHVTWDSYSSMLRQYKTYIFEPALSSVVFSGYPGIIHSVDDWYMTGARLAVMETTIDIPKTELFVQNIKGKNHTISAFYRVMIANLLSTSAPSWAHHFAVHNSGTYNNQWMVVDMTKVTPGAGLPPDTLWIVETLPGIVAMRDLTPQLNKEGYFASYNVALLTYEASGSEAAAAAEGDFYSYTKCPRALLFERNQSLVKDIPSLKRVMRLNDYKVDPLSLIANCTGAGHGTNKCHPPYSAMLAISARGDLNPPGSSEEYGPYYPYLNQRNHGGIDVKIATYQNMKLPSDAVLGIVVSGPTNDQVPTFQWSASPWRDNASVVLRLGQPDTFDFPFVEYKDTLPFPQLNGSESSNNTVVIIGIIIGSVAAAIVLSMIILITLRSRKEQAERRKYALLDNVH